MINKGILPLSFGGGAALISVVTGFASGVSPGILLFRGLLSAIASVAFIILAGWLIDTFLPELSDLNGGKVSSDPSAETPGSRVNIVMSDEEGESAKGKADTSLDGYPPSSAGSDEREENEIAETAGSVHNNKPDDSDSDPLDSDGLDILPNLDSLEINMGESSSNYDEEESIGADKIETEAPVTSLNVSNKMGEHSDPEQIAKAVKTVLARDK